MTIMDIDGKRYEFTLAASGYELEWSYGSSGEQILTKPRIKEPCNTCEHCHRFDVRDKIAFSFEQAIEFGWFKEVNDEN